MSHGQVQSQAHGQAEAQKRLKVAEAQDGFFAKVAASPVNIAARRSSSYIAWNDQSLAEVAKDMLDPEDRWVDIIILDPSAEGGMPHTRPGLICLPAYYPTSRLADTLKHEMVHISQKRQPTLWASRAEVEGWQPVNQNIIPESWSSRLRLNPDTAGTMYAWKGRYIPLPVYVREDKPLLRDIQVRWYDITEGIVQTTPPTSFTQSYGNRGALGASQSEHPYELWAYD
jgi:hypothetical protein